MVRDVTDEDRAWTARQAFCVSYARFFQLAPQHCRLFRGVGVSLRPCRQSIQRYLARKLQILAYANCDP